MEEKKIMIELSMGQVELILATLNEKKTYKGGLQEASNVVTVAQLLIVARDKSIQESQETT